MYVCHTGRRFVRLACRLVGGSGELPHAVFLGLAVSLRLASGGFGGLAGCEARSSSGSRSSCAISACSSGSSCGRSTSGPREGIVAVLASRRLRGRFAQGQASRYPARVLSFDDWRACGGADAVRRASVRHGEGRRDGARVRAG
eukprot:5972066-Prymnesium_polylepis.1